MLQNPGEPRSNVEMPESQSYAPGDSRIRFSVVIFSSAEPPQVKQLLRHLTAAFPQAKLSLLYETPRPPSSVATEPGRTLTLRAISGFIGRASLAARSRIRAASIEALDHLLRRLHAAHRYPRAQSSSLDELQDYVHSRGVSFSVIDDFHGEATLEFVQTLNPDLGVVYGSRPLDQALFTIPRRGSISVHTRELVCDGAEGHPGLAESRIVSLQQVVTVHRLAAGAAPGPVVGRRAFPILEYDTPASIAVKSELLGIECLVDVIRSQTAGCALPESQMSTELVCPQEEPCTGAGHEPVASRVRKRFEAKHGRPLIKLLARFLLYPRAWFLNRRRLAKEEFPVVIFFGHLVADRAHFMGISTDQFLRQVKFLKKHYRIVSLQEAIDMLRQRKVSEPTVVLTFDDGYADNHLGMRAVIDSEEIPVALFVCTERVEHHRPFNHDLKLGESDFFPLTWDQVKDFERQGSTIGSHTRTHFDCGSADEAALRAEIAGAHEDLRLNLGHDVPFFAFPCGHPENMSAAAIRIASETYPSIFEAFGGTNEIHGTASAVYKRIGLPQSLLELELSLQGILDFRTNRRNRTKNQARRSGSAVLGSANGRATAAGGLNRAVPVIGGEVQAF
jgi:Polysaccharide deacetylase